MEYISTKEITKEIRENLKKEFPNLKFSVTYASFAGGSSVDVSLISGNFNPFVSGISEHIQINNYHTGKEDRITEDTKNILSKVLEIVSKRNYNNSDSSIDYFDTNFYYHISIGKWDKLYIDTSVLGV